jgi:hypothetical protein
VAHDRPTGGNAAPQAAPIRLNRRWLAHRRLGQTDAMTRNGPTFRRPLRLANFSGYLGDRFTALAEVLDGDPVDVLTGDYLAEITLAHLAALHHRDGRKGYVDSFVAQVRPQLSRIAERGLKLVTNAGGFHPEALAAHLRGLIAEAGLDLQVAHVAGDNLLTRLPAIRAAGHALTHMDTGEPLAAWAVTPANPAGAQPIAANAYIGGWGIAAALREGADIVICGRVTDASLTVGPCAWWHGWAQDDWDALAGAVVAGHIIECGPHATGGNFSGFEAVPGLQKPGFPIAEVAADGSAVITKHAGQGGMVTVDTVTAQLVYEIQGPVYLNPDVTTDLTGVQLTQLAPDRVGVHSARGLPPPATTKLALFADIGWQLVNMVFVAGREVDAKIAVIEAQLRDWAGAARVDHLEVTRFGRPDTGPGATQTDATVAVRIMATAAEQAPLLALAKGLNSLYLSSVPGYHLDTGARRVSEPWARTEFWPAVLPVELLHHEVVLADGRHLTVPHPPSGPLLPQPPSQAAMATATDGPTQAVPLGLLVHARCGDKGGNSNVGLWARDAAAWPWLRAFLGAETLRTLLPESCGLEVLRHELPALHAVHFVLKGLLGRGGSSNLRADQAGKAVGEAMLAKQVAVPVDLLVRLGLVPHC